MSSDRLDLVVFGASGYTGKYVLRELTRVALKYPGLTWAVAGRSRERLENLLREVTNKTGVDLSSTKIIVAAVEDASSLRRMCGAARVVLNCCGPFSKLGAPVVAAAVACGAHYVDVCGEKLFVDECLRNFEQAARQARVHVVPTCGLSSAPADLAVVHLQQNFGGTLNSVESYLMIDFPAKLLAERTKGIVRYSTWESMINSMAAMPIRIIQEKQSPSPFKPQLKRRGLVHRNLDKWCFPFPGTDSDVINKTQQHLLSMDLQRPAQYQAYIAFPSIFTAICVVFFGALLLLFSKVSFLRKLLLDYPRVCTFGIVTRGHPQEGVMDDLCFQYVMVGEGWEEGSDIENTPPNRKVVGGVRVFGADAAYVGTAVVVIYSALAILHESDKMPNSGAMTPGVAFRNTSLVKNLQENNFKFEIVSN